MQNSKYKITASLVLFRTGCDDLTAVLQSVAGSPIDRLYIIDNSPSDDARRIIRGFHNPRFEYIFGQGNIGYGAANNIGIKKSLRAGARYHIVINPDVSFSATTIANLARYMDNNPDVGSIFPNVEYPDGRPQHLCKLLPTPVDIFARRLLPRAWFEKRNQRYEMQFTGYDKICDCPVSSGCFMFLRNSVLQKTGLFDPRFFLYFEDFDLLRRMSLFAKNIFYPAETITHRHNAAHRNQLPALRHSIISAIRYFNKWGWAFDRERKIINRTTIAKHLNNTPEIALPPSTCRQF